MKRTEKIEIRVSQAEKAAIIEKAGDMSLSDYLRGLALPLECHDKQSVKCHDKVESVMTNIEPIPESVMTDTENVMTVLNSVMTNNTPFIESVMTIKDNVMTKEVPAQELREPQTPIETLGLLQAMRKTVEQPKKVKPWSGGYGKAISSK